MSVKTFAAIDIGSFEQTMKLFELSGKNKIKEIDCISRRLNLGSDTYSEGKISNEKMDELCETLKEFAEVMNAYKVDAYRAYGTSAIRETANTNIVLDQIAQRTGIYVEILSNSEQRFLDYKSVASRGESFRRIIEEKTAIVDIGGSSIQLSLFEKDALVSTQNMKLGVLRIRDMLRTMNAGHTQVEELVDEMASAQLSAYKKLYLKDREIHNLIIVDDYISPIAIKKTKGSGEDALLPTRICDKYLELYHSHNAMQLAQLFDVPEESVELIQISAVLIRRIANLMGVENIWAPGVTLCDGMAYEYAEQTKRLSGEHDFEKDILACATNISKRYMGSKKRGETLEQITTIIFDSMKKVHGLGKREHLYLRLAAILHDCGKYISLMSIGENSYNIIMATEIIGLSHLERQIVANVVRFNHSKFEYQNTEMPSESNLVVAKLVAILRLANSLDRSHKQKFKGIKANLTDHELVLSVDTQEDITLESSFFENSTDFFKEVFSITPVLKQKKHF